MNRYLMTSLLATTFAFASTACEKEGKTADEGKTTTPSKTATKDKAPGASRPTAQPGTAKAPLATDIAKYTEGLSGTGKLMVRFNTNQGIITCELFEKQAPLTVSNFVGLARGLHPFTNLETKRTERRPFYDGLIFHRVIPEFMIQGGDPLGKGVGGPGYKFAQEVSPELRHDKPGVLSMANAGPNTNGSQFFITEVPKKSLDGGYNVFGQCNEIDVVKKIARVEKRGSTPNEPVIMEKVEIYRAE
jgi:peptidyl-prolyl cis-trans isomerase A (cyclophilin A)